MLTFDAVALMCGLRICVFEGIVVTLRAFGEWNKKGTFRKAVL